MEDYGGRDLPSSPLPPNFISAGGMDEKPKYITSTFPAYLWEVIMRIDFIESLRNQDLCDNTQIRVGQAFEITNNRTEADVLRILCFWQAKAQTKRNGRMWIIKTAQELQTDGMNCSHQTIRRALKRLKEKGLILIEHHPHPFRTGVLNASWICLSDETTAFIEQIRHDEQQ